MQDIPGEPIGGRMAQRRDGARHILRLRQPAPGIFASGGLEDLLDSLIWRRAGVAVTRANSGVPAETAKRSPVKRKSRIWRTAPPPNYLFTATDFNSYVTVSNASGAPQRKDGRMAANRRGWWSSRAGNVLPAEARVALPARGLSKKSARLDKFAVEQ